MKNNILYFWVPLMSSVGCGLLGVFVFWKNPRQKLNRYFAFFLLAASVWSLSGCFKYYEVMHNYVTTFPIKYDWVTVVFLFYTLVLFSWHFPYETKRMKKSWFLALTVVNVGVLILSFTDMFITEVSIKNDRYFYSQSPFYLAIFVPYVLGSILYSMGTIGSKFFRTSNYIEKQRIKYLLFGYTFGFAIGAIAGMILPLFEIRRFEIVTMAAPFFGNIPVAYSIVRYRLLEIDTVIHKTILWGITSIFVVIPGLIFFWFLFPIIKDWGWLAASLVLLGLYHVFYYYHRLIQPKVNMLFRRKKYDYYQVLAEVGTRIGTEVHVDVLINKVLKEIKQVLYPRKITALLWNEGTGQYLEFGQQEEKISLHVTSPLITWLECNRIVMEKDQLEIDPQYEQVKGAAAVFLKQNELEILLPIFFKGKLKTVIGLGKKENLSPFTSIDLELLSKISQQIGVAIDNALHYGEIVEKEKMAEEMELGQKIQMSLLPKEAPSVPGLTVRGLTIPAKEIGGDYYDYIVTSGAVVGDQLGIAIGDVSGKGIAAGILMAIAKATVMTISKSSSDPKEILNKANSILYENMKAGGHFMSLLYMQWDSQTKTMNYCGAGHEYIIIYRADGKLSAERKQHSASCIQQSSVEVVPAGGLILGVIPDVSKHLQLRTLSLNVGDKIILYSDGVTTAQNKEGDFFSLEKLESLVAQKGSHPLDTLIQELKYEVYSFMGTADQYDDITLVCAEVS